MAESIEFVESKESLSGLDSQYVTPTYTDSDGNKHVAVVKTLTSAITDEDGKRLDRIIDDLKKTGGSGGDLTGDINAEIDKKVGNLENLTTNDKTTVVNAVNEVHAGLTSASANLSQAESAIDSLQQGLSDSNQDIGELQQDLQSLSDDLSKIPDSIIGENLIINGNFAINQRGEKEYIYDSAPKSSIYFVDRWSIGGGNPNIATGKFTITDKGELRGEMTSTTGGGNHIDLIQIFDNDVIKKTNGKTITFSIKVSEMLNHGHSTIFLWGRVNGTFRNLGEIQFSNIGIFSKTVTLPEEMTYLSIRIYFTDSRYGSVVGDYMTVEYVKLELGSVATPFVPPDPAIELVKCQRYYYRISTKSEDGNTDFGFFALGISNGNATDAIIYLPESMRTFPTLKYDGLMVYNDDFPFGVQTASLYPSYCSKDNRILFLSLISNQTLPLGYSFIGLTDDFPASFISFDAEIY